MLPVFSKHKPVAVDPDESASSGLSKTDRHYRLSARRTLACKLLGIMPPAWREPIAECLLRRKSSPGPAAEHVIQHLLSHKQHQRKSRNNRDALVSKAADFFYANQYRQYLNPMMSAFAATAVQVLAAG
ncbi:MAG: hypothetical protein PHH11_07330, partial [Methylomonas sp.]|nr:hypothetical protein [Methylomonas sp.]